MHIGIPRAFQAVTLVIAVILSGGTALSYGQPQEPDDAEEDSAQSSQRGSDRGSGSFVDGVLQNTGRRVGFSAGVYHVYSTDGTVETESNRPKAINYSAVQPRIFAQLSGRRTTFNIDYEFGYSVYNARLREGTPRHSLTLRFQQTLSRNVSLEFTNAARSSYNDGGFSSATSAISLGSTVGTFGQDLYLSRQRITSNFAVLNLGYRLSTKGAISFWGSHEYQKYSDGTFEDWQAAQAGIRGEFQLTRWLSWDSGFTTYLNTVDIQNQRGSIQRIQIGGLRHRTRRGLEFSASGGLEHSRSFGLNQTGASVQAGILKISEGKTFGLSYHRGFSTANGPGIVLSGDDVSASATIRLSERVSVNASSAYMTGSSVRNFEFLESVSGSGSIDIAVQRHLLLSVQYSHIWQDANNIPDTANSASRYGISAGLQYFLPSLYGR